jgi:N-carbamoylputrescine amidase
VLERFRKLAAELDVVLPVSFFERGEDGPYNSLVLFDADGSELGRYRKAHIPEGPGYEERDYFRPGGTPFLVRDTKYGRIGCAVCWDQWFPEAARAMALEGAELLLYPTAIGSEPHAPELDTAPHWRTVMRGHAGANLCYLAAANRVGRERGESCAIDFYGSSFVAGPFGEVLAEAGRGEEAVLESLIDLDRVAGLREDWGFFRHRRPDLYVGLTTGGKT